MRLPSDLLDRDWIVCRHEEVSPCAVTIIKSRAQPHLKLCSDHLHTQGFLVVRRVSRTRYDPAATMTRVHQIRFQAVSCAANWVAQAATILVCGASTFRVVLFMSVSRAMKLASFKNAEPHLWVVSKHSS